MNFLMIHLYVFITTFSYENVKSIPLQQLTIYRSEFMKFISEYNKKYDTFRQVESAFSNFAENLVKFENHDMKQNGYNIGITQFADMNTNEFEVYKGGACLKTTNTRRCRSFSSTDAILPESIDWRTKNAVTPVKNQESCGSCWSFSATGAMEGAWAVKYGELLSLSEQELIGCSSKYGNNGCNGGLMDSAFEYVIDYGLCKESDTPYKAVDDKCDKCSTSAVKFSSCVDVTPNNQLHLKEAVSLGPVSIAIEADTSVFQHYTGGIISSSSCGTNLDHGVLIVGYGTDDNGTKYWTVKNSWGPRWGEEGYLRIARSDSYNDVGICGISMQPSFPIVSV